MKLPHTLRFFWPILGLSLLIGSCRDNPVNTGNPNTLQATGEVDPSGPTTFLLGTTNHDRKPGQLEVWAHNLQVADSTVSFDAVIVNKSRWPAYAPIHFVITEIRPNRVEVDNADFVGPDGPVFDFSDDIGPDGMLGSGEKSDAVTMRFRWPEPMAFAIGFRIDTGDGPEDDTGFISGIVFKDLDGDGELDMNIEPGIPGVVVEARPSAREILYRTRTDRDGHYKFDDLSADVYTVKAHAEHMKPTSPNPLIVTLVELPDSSVSGFDDADFGFQGGPMPPNPSIFGPVPVGPGSPLGAEFDSTFVIPEFFHPVDLFLKVVPPPLMAPMRVCVDTAYVAINDEVVWRFVEDLKDPLCMPWARMLLDEELHGENEISIRVTGDPKAFLFFSIEAKNKERDD